MARAAADAESADPSLPRPGLMAIVRNRRGVIASVDEFDAGPEGSLHLVTVEYTDTDGPPEEQLLWEREPRAHVVSPSTLPRVLKDRPMEPREFDALTDATRWSAVTPYLSPDDESTTSETTVAAPFYGAVQSEDFQIVPLLRAMRMPRVSLMLADDVGLGKTIEAGMIMRELLLRRRARRILILTPASLREQWAEEMREKFSLSFDLVDRKSTQKLKKRRGLDANPWRTHPRIIASYHYLRQPNIREEFRAATRPDSDRRTSAKLPWDLLIVDEAHNLMPSAYGENSQLADMLRSISPWFEHKLFLTATPHNGYTRSFTGLLESLDPVRFQQTSELNPDDADVDYRDRVDQIVVRRLKRDINDLDERRGRPRRFAKRKLHPVQIEYEGAEARLNRAFEQFRHAVKETVKHRGLSDSAANFAVQILNKRLLSSPYTFADSWLRFTDGLDRSDAADDRRVHAARRAAQRDIDDDRERESVDRRAARTTGAWLKEIADDLTDEIDDINEALEGLGIDRDDVAISDDGETVQHLPVPSNDARYDALRDLVEQKLTDDGDWADDERLVVFTEYKTTLDYLVDRLREDFDDPDGRRILFLFGGMAQNERADVKRAFNDPDHPVRILVGTDAASEGLNLQKTARLLLHFDVPWNPSVLDQRNGRLDRHGQARDVHIYHFDSEHDADTRFVSRVVGKVEEIREDLGSMGEVFDAAFEARFLEQQDADHVFDNLETETDQRKGQTEAAHTGEDEELIEQAGVVDDYHDHLGLTPERLSNALEVAMAMREGYPQLDGPDDEGRYRFHGGNVPTRWRDVVEEELLVAPDDSAGRSNIKGALPKLVFDPDELVEDNNGRPVFRTPGDTVLMHLGHPVLRHALARFARARFPTSGEQNATRWIARRGQVPEGADVVVTLHVEEMAVNELREPFHHWVRPLRFAVRGTELGERLPYGRPDEKPRHEDPNHDEDLLDEARRIWPALQSQLEQQVDQHRERLTDIISEHLGDTREAALEEARQRFDERRDEVRHILQTRNVNNLKQELEKVRRQQYQTSMLVAQERELEMREQELQDEIRRREQRYDDLLERLADERERMVEQVLPKRHTLSGDVQVFPVTTEIVLPE